MKRILTSLLMCLCGFAGLAQQDPQFSQNMFNRLSINPGVAGTSDAICGTLLYRQQWLGFGDGIPKTGLLSVDAPFKMLHGGLGVTFMNDQIGFNSTNMFRLAYAYHMNLGSGKFAVGLDAGLYQLAMDGDNWIAQNMTDPNLPPTTQDMAPDFNFGAYYFTNDLYAGLSATHLSGGNLNLGNASFGIARHYYLIGGYNYALNPAWTLKPSIWAKSDLASTQVDVNLSALYNNLVWAGASYRLKDAIVAMVGVNVGNFKIGYSYDITTSTIRNYSSGTHEIMLGFCYKPNPTKPLPLNRNTRFL